MKQEASATLPSKNSYYYSADKAELMPWLENQRINFYKTPRQEVYQDPSQPPRDYKKNVMRQTMRPYGIHDRYTQNRKPLLA